MIISGKQIQSVVKTYAEMNKATKNKTEQTEFKTVQKQDEVILSSGAQEFGQILQGLKDVSDVREDKVKELSGRVDDGTYYVDANDIADKMIGRTLVDSLK
ncbi:MAG: flagellar biosynthesis anti-sigma factor FlgM [Pelosinus sp.]|nr:flagellar biosynthesis anti-sigma factor FlgM [Pelosinus sp.]